MKTFDQVVSQSDVVFIVGTGFSAATSQGAPTATWIGLIRSGIQRAREINDSLTDEWSGPVEGLIAYGINSNTVAPLISAAGMVSTALKEAGDLAFSSWLRDDIGGLDVKSDRLGKAILAYPFPVLTTNYDTLLEKVSGRSSEDWTDTAGFHEVVTRASESIGHIHGVWNRPDSVILTEADYTNLLAHESTRALEQAMSTLKSIVYIGFGGGLNDPNFAALLKWHRETFPHSSVTHYRLCREDEQEMLTKEHANDHVLPVVYGKSHDDLPAFLERYAPSSAALVTNEVGLARDIVQEAREQLRDSMTSESVLADAGAGDLLSNDLVIPPVLLPVPHATFVRERIKSGASAEVERIDGLQEVKSHDFFVIVGDEGAGLTTAIKWLATQSSEVLGSAAPVFLRFSDCRVRKDPFGIAVKEAAFSCGLVQDRDAELPPHVVAIDDVSASVPRLSDRVLAGIAASPAIVKVVGCKQGYEDELVSQLQDLGITPRILFLGRMRKSDIVALAQRLSPAQGNRLAEETLRVLDAEGLQRTPLTVSLLLFLTFRGSPAETRSLTNVLDAYTALLLGIGDPHTNETGLTETDLTAVLGKFAESLIWDERPSLTEAESMRTIATILDKFSWKANASSVLAFFLQRRILHRHGGMIEFARYSYFTLFAAKRAMVDRDFRELIVGDLFYYMPVATRLAAFSRADEGMLQQLRGLLDEELNNVVTPGSPYEPTALITIEELPDSASKDLAVPEPAGADPDDIEFPESSSTGSFGLVKADMTATARLHRTLSLVSSVLRDLDQVENLALKKEILLDTLELWGRFITVLSDDSSLSDLRKAVTKQLEGSNEAGSAEADELADFLSRSIPAGVAIGGIEKSLSSPKLVSVLETLLDSGEIQKTNERLTAALLFLFLLRSRDWAIQATMLVNQAQATWVLTTFFHALCQDAFVQGTTPEQDLLELCKALYLKGQNFASADIRSAHLDQYVQQLRNQRAKAKQMRHTTH